MTSTIIDLAATLLIAMECGGDLGHYLAAYQDGGGVWTIGCGSTFMPSGRRVRAGDVLGQAEALALLDQQIATWSRVIVAAIRAQLTDAQTAVLISFVHQEGASALPGSVLADMLNEGLIARAAGQLNGWVIGRNNGVRQPVLGIMRRQETQRRMMLGAPLEPTRTQVWSLGAATLLPRYSAACADAAAYRRSARLPRVPGPAPMSPAPLAATAAKRPLQAGQADRLMAAEQAAMCDSKGV